MANQYDNSVIRLTYYQQLLCVVSDQLMISTHSGHRRILTRTIKICKRADAMESKYGHLKLNTTLLDRPLALMIG